MIFLLGILFIKINQIIVIHYSIHISTCILWIWCLIMLVVLQDEDDHECGIMTSDVEADHGEGFVCERIINPDTAFTEFQPSWIWLKIHVFCKYIITYPFWWSLSSPAVFVSITPEIWYVPDKSACYCWSGIWN